MYFDIVNCPYCGYENDMSDGCIDLPDDNKFDHECESCGKDFEVEVEFNPSYTASEIVFEECERCKTPVRDIYEKDAMRPYPQNIKETKICFRCWRELIFERFYN